MRGQIISWSHRRQFGLVACDDGSAASIGRAELPAHIFPELQTPVGLRIDFDLSLRDRTAHHVYVTATR